MYMRYIKVLISGLLAGALIGLGGLGYIISRSYIPDSGLLIGSLIFPFGLYLICLLGRHLYTGRIGIAFNDKEKIKDNVIDLLLMLLGNLLGALLLGLIARLLFANDTNVINLIESISDTKSNINPLLTLLKSFLCGMLVYLAVSLYKKANSEFGKFIGVLIPIFLFVYLGLDHCIANMFYFAFGYKFIPFQIVNLLVAILGNSIGALVLNYLSKLLEIK